MYKLGDIAKLRTANKQDIFGANSIEQELYRNLKHTAQNSFSASQNFSYLIGDEKYVKSNIQNISDEISKRSEYYRLKLEKIPITCKVKITATRTHNPLDK